MIQSNPTIETRTHFNWKSTHRVHAFSDVIYCVCARLSLSFSRASSLAKICAWFAAVINFKTISMHGKSSSTTTAPQQQQQYGKLYRSMTRSHFSEIMKAKRTYIHTTISDLMKWFARKRKINVAFMSSDIYSFIRTHTINITYQLIYINMLAAVECVTYVRVYMQFNFT